MVPHCSLCAAAWPALASAVTAAAVDLLPDHRTAAVPAEIA
jgi:hypothetical protein